MSLTSSLAWVMIALWSRLQHLHHVRHFPHHVLLPLASFYGSLCFCALLFDPLISLLFLINVLEGSGSSLNIWHLQPVLRQWHHGFSEFWRGPCGNFFSYLLCWCLFKLRHLCLTFFLRVSHHSSHLLSNGLPVVFRHSINFSRFQLSCLIVAWKWGEPCILPLAPHRKNWKKVQNTDTKYWIELHNIEQQCHLAWIAVSWFK